MNFYLLLFHLVNILGMISFLEILVQFLFPLVVHTRLQRLTAVGGAAMPVTQISNSHSG